MIRLAFTIVAGIVLGLVVHLVSVLALPRIATQDAYSRLTPMTKENAVTQLPLADPNTSPMPFMRGRCEPDRPRSDDGYRLSVGHVATPIAMIRLPQASGFTP